MAYISQIKDTSGTTHQIRPYTASLSSVNLNTIVDSGFYAVSSCSNSKYSAATLVCVKNGTGCTQTETDVATGSVAVRSYNGTSWSEWSELSPSITITETSAGLLSITPAASFVSGDDVAY